MPSPNYTFADFTFRAGEESLYKAGAPVKLRSRAAQVLRVLVENRGRLIRKEEFFDEVWRDACVEDNNLTVAIAQLRKALGETDERRFIETVPRKGYRFVAPVEEVFGDEGVRAAAARATRIETGGDEVAAAEVATAEHGTATVGAIEGESVGGSEPDAGERASTVAASHGSRRRSADRVGRPEADVSAVAVRRVAVFIALVLLLFSVGMVWRRSLFVTRIEPPRAIAVLPFSISTASREHQLYAEELTQDLTHDLARASDVRVSAYDAASAFDASEAGLAKAGNELKIDAAVIGTTRRDEDKINLQVELRDLRDGASIWKRDYSFGEHDLPATHRRVAHDLAAQIGGREPSGDRRATNDPEAYRAYLVARRHSAGRSLRDEEKAIEAFTLATIRDSSFADAHAGLAVAHIQHGLHLYASRGLAASRGSFPAAKERAGRALQLDDACDEALSALAFVNYRYDYDPANAERNFRRAVGINPNNVLARRWYGEFLHATGRFDEGFAEQRAALALEPNSPRILNEMAWGGYLAGRLDEAASYTEAANAIDRTYAAALYNASEIYEAKGDYRLAAVAWKEAMTLEDANRKRIADIEDSFERRGYEGFARSKVAWLESLLEREFEYPVDLAKGYAAIGDKERAVAWLLRGVAARAPDAVFVEHAPALAALRDDARFRASIAEMNLPR